ncbi:MAG: carbonic anhydrase [Bdellovibrionales bacterium]|jgi:carbonic anhydrase|nr:carbonic anhydrase [Bdellovibrionales bacterium]
MPVRFLNGKPASVVTAFIGLSLFFSLQVSFAASSDNGHTAPVHANDQLARKIRRDVASENLKTISTKESESENVLVVQNTNSDSFLVEQRNERIVEPLEDEVPSLPLKPQAQPQTAAVESEPVDPIAPSVITSEPSPGSRSLAAESDETSPVTPTVNDGVSSEQALSWLVNGNKRYVKQSFRSDGKSQSDRKRLEKTEKPHSIVLACSDSRVPPEAVFDQALGEIYVVRTAGESLDAAVIASLEHAVKTLEPSLLVVMGHTRCDTIRAAVETPLNDSAGSAALDQLLADIRPRLPKRSVSSQPAKHDHSHDYEIESSANAQGIATDLVTRSELIRTKVESGKLLIKPALYYMDTGLVKFY